MAEVIRRGLDSLLRSEGPPSREELKQRALATIGRFRSGKSDISARHDDYLAEAFRR